MPWKLSAPWVLIRQLREVMASSSEPQAKLDRIVKVIAANMVAEVSSIYVRLADGSLELIATEGLRAEAVHQLKMRKGEGLVGLIAEWRESINLPEAQKHPAFSYKAETGEERYHSFLGVPIQRDHRTLGVLTVQNRIERKYSDEEVEALQTTAMVLAEMIASGAFTPAGAAAPDRRSVSLTLRGAAINDGIAMGHVVLHEPRVHIDRFFADNIQVELQRLEDAVAELRRVMDSLVHKGDTSKANEHREIIETVRMLAHDQGWARRMREAVIAGLTAEAAVERVQQNMRTQFLRHADSFWRERLHDLDDLANRLLRILNGKDGGKPASAKLPADSILVARNMGAAELLDYDTTNLRGLVIEDGGATSHVSIVARSLGIAALVQVQDVLSAIDHGDPMVLDATVGEVHIRPSLELIRAYSDKVRFRAKRQAQFERLKNKPAVTKDGTRIQVNMNAGLLVDLPNFGLAGADGIGLFRTELQFMISSTFPRLNQQQAAYERVLDAAEGRPVIFRSLDVGSDKVLPYLKTAKEENPALGWRAIRMSLDRPSLFRMQVRALLRAAAGRELRLMIPFVTEVGEFIEAKALIQKEVEHAKKHGHALPKELQTGVMLEVPALVWQLDALLPLVDFVSVGSNDLLQFLFAADRDNHRVARRFDSLNLAAMRVMREIVVKADQHKVSLGLCGEMAGRPMEALALLGLGFRAISMSPASIGPVKAMILSANAQDTEEFTLGLLDKNCTTIRNELMEFARKNDIRI